MKKLILMLALIFLITGCSIESLSNEEIAKVIETSLSKNIDSSNSYFTGYKYYLPRGMKLLETKEYNQIILANNYKYYLYVDVVSYYNKKQIESNQKGNYYSQKINYDDKAGYIEIDKKEDRLFVEIVFNYAKIEVYVSPNDLNTTIIKAVQILSSIQYNDAVINRLVGENKLDYNETICDIFTKKRDGDFLEYEQEYGQYEEEESKEDVTLESDN